MASLVLVSACVCVTLGGWVRIVTFLTATLNMDVLVLLNALESAMEFVELDHKDDLSVDVHLAQNGWENAAISVVL